MRVMIGLAVILASITTSVAAMTLSNVPSLSTNSPALHDPDVQMEALADGMARRTFAGDADTVAARAARRDARRLRTANPAQRDTPSSASLLGLN